MRQGYVYFFQDADLRVKIGKSDDPHRRLRDLKRDVGHRLTVIGVMQSAEPLVEEARILRECIEHRIEGEWFTCAVIPKIEIYRSRFIEKLPEPKQLLIQSWVSPELYEALVMRAKKEGRTLANYVRRELGKLAGVDE